MGVSGPKGNRRKSAHSFGAPWEIKNLSFMFLPRQGHREETAWTLLGTQASASL